MANLVYFFYELPIPASGLDAPNRVILSGTPVDTPPDPKTDPFGFETTFRLDPRSQALIGKEIVTVPFIDFVEDAIEVPAPTRPRKKRTEKPLGFRPKIVPRPVPDTSLAQQLQFDWTL